MLNSEIKNILKSSMIDPSRNVRHAPAKYTVVIRSLFWVNGLFLLAGLAFAITGWPVDARYHGPFLKEPASGSQSLVLPLGNRLLRNCCLDSRGDNNEHPSRSQLQLWIDGVEIGPPHALHTDLRVGTIGAYSHWANYIVFSLPPGIANSSATEARVFYEWRPREGTLVVLFASTVLFGLLAYRRIINSVAVASWELVTGPGANAVEIFIERWGSTIVATLTRAPYVIALAVGYTLLAACVLYLACNAYALLTGWAMPTTAAIEWLAIFRWAATHEPYFGHALIAFAGCGTILFWIAALFPTSARDDGEQNEVRLQRFLGRWSFLILACGLVGSLSIMWLGTVRPGDLHTSSIGGLIGFSDAGGHLASAYDQAHHGVWSAFALRRPLAAAFRSVLLFFSGFSLSNMLLLQACLLSLALCFAASAILRWRGIWTAIAFVGFAYTYIRPFAPTTLTEPLGLFWALVAIPFMVAMLRTRNLTHALPFFAFTTLALMTRMGSMFTIPAMALWIGWQCAHTTVERGKAAVLMLMVLCAVVSASAGLQKAYGQSERSIGGNFSYTLCGLTLGTTWEGCTAKVAAEGRSLPSDEEEMVKFMYRMAWDNFQKNPVVLFQRLTEGIRSFVKRIPEWLLGSEGRPSWFPTTHLTMLLGVGLVYITLMRRERGELSFWLLVGLSIIASASIVIFDDGLRVLAASHPTLSLFFAIGMSGPAMSAQKNATPYSGLRLVAAVVPLVVTVMFFGVPLLAHHFFSVERVSGLASLVHEPDEAVVFGGRRMAGFIIVADGTPLRKDAPMMHLSDFAAVLEAGGLETLQGLIHPEVPPLPFAFVFAPRLENNVSSDYQYIVPATVLEQHDVQVWRFQLKHWQTKTAQKVGYGSDYWFYATRSESLR
jgi:hypothetical protein